MQKAHEFTDAIKSYTSSFYPVISFDKEADKLLLMDFTERNKELTEEMVTDTKTFSHYIHSKLQSTNAKYGIGGYNEHRTIYSRSEIFGPRRLHLGIDIWGEVGTAVHAPMEATVHSFGFNDAFGDYGATIILQHELEGFIFHTLYGHLSLHSIQDLREGQEIEKGQWIAAFGEPHENGHWPPHLHFQIILDMQGYKGDYPGVCAFSERESYLGNCPDPDLLLGMMTFAVQKERDHSP
jgi:murein DD-endopeptidase MepM/ murein hydrolase activator NlpD